jgi:hypothetical protein
MSSPASAAATPAPATTPTPRNAYQTSPASSDRTQRCPNRNGEWPPLYKRQWDPHPARSLDKLARERFQRCVLDAVEADEIHRTTGQILLAFAHASDKSLTDVWISQRTVGQRLKLAESTVCHHVAKAKRAGWIAVQHRNRIDNGMVHAMSNVTRLQLPLHWQDQVDEQRRERVARQTRDRRARGRVGSPTHRRDTTPASAHKPAHRSEAQLAASTGAATARSASTATFEQGREELEEQFLGRPDLFEAAYDEFVNVWRTIRKNE